MYKWIAIVLSMQAVVAWASQVTHPGACVTVENRLTATDQEAQEGYFALGDGRERLVLVVMPNSQLAVFLRSKVGTEFRVVLNGGRCP